MEEQIWKSDLNSPLSSNIGRVINTLLSARPRKLEDTINCLASASQRSVGSLGEPLCFLRNYISNAVEKGETLDQILVPMIESCLKSKDSRRCNQVLILLNWLFKDELLFHFLATNLARVVVSKADRFITLGWCTLIRGLVNYESAMTPYSNTGIQEKHRTLLQILFPSISHLSSVLCNGSIVQGGLELPTRLAVAAADCILVLTEASTKAINTPGASDVKRKLCEQDLAKKLVALPTTASIEKQIRSTSKLEQCSNNMELEVLLWDHMDELIILVQRLLVWSGTSRPLHVKGLQQVLKWLQEIKGYCCSVSVKAGGGTLKTGASLLSSCWKHYGMLLRLEDHRFSQQYLDMLNQYISGIQFYMNDYSYQHFGNKDGGIETRKFFMICISLLLGRLDQKQFGAAISEHGMQMTHLLLSQLQCDDEDVTEVTVSILRAIIYMTNYPSTDRSLIDTQQMETMFPLLLNLLDERDTTSRAVVMLIAEYCSINTDGQCLQEVFKRLAAESVRLRRNAIEIISELMKFSSDSKNLVSHSMRKDIAQNLIGRLADDESDIRVQASNLLVTYDPQLVLPALVRLVYNPYERVRTSATNTLVNVLKFHNRNAEVIVMLIDCLSKICQSPDGSNHVSGEVEGSKDSDQLLKVIPHWSNSVQDWSIFVEPLIDKMLAEPSNAVLVRFLSYISEKLVKVQDVVLYRVLSYMQRQKEIDEKSSNGAWGDYKRDDSLKFKDHIFERLCPLLIIKLLPLNVFNDLNSIYMYDQLLNQDALLASRIKRSNSEDSSCIVTILVSRAFHKSEFEEVRKLAAELCGRIHPQVLFPIIRSQLEHATYSRNILMMKACLFAICTSLVLRGRDSADHPAMLEIRMTIEKVLSWPSMDADEVSKAQHGCIDCLALTICAELQTPDSFIDSSKNKIRNASKNSVLNYVIQNLISNDSGKLSPDVGCESKAAVSVSFQLCMANVLISACQKISDSGKNTLAERLLPALIRAVEVITDSEVRAACIQVLFSAVYHLKSAILPYSCDLLKLSVKALRKGSHKEKMASVKLMTSLMASEDVIVGSITGGLLEARSVVSNVYITDLSTELRQVCKLLLECISVSSPVDEILQNVDFQH